MITLLINKKIILKTQSQYKKLAFTHLKYHNLETRLHQHMKALLLLWFKIGFIYMEEDNQT